MSTKTASELFPATLTLRALEQAREGVVVIHGDQPEHPVVWVNQAFETMTGFRSAELLGRNLRILQGGDREQAGIAELREAIAGERSCTVLLRNYRADGAMYWNQLCIEPCRDENGTLWWFGYARDVSSQREMEIMLGRHADELEQAERRLADVDPIDRLTGLQSERSFEVALELSWFSCARDRRSIALFLFAPDYFDAYLETFGRVAADSCLRMLARGVSAAFRRASDVTGRLGEAQFAALGTSMEKEVLETHARRVVERVRALAIRNPRAPLGRNVTLSAAVSLVHPGRAPDWRGLLEETRRILGEAQAAGVEQVVVNDYGMD